MTNPREASHATAAVTILAPDERRRQNRSDRKALSFAMTLSLAIGLLMFVMKVGAYLLTGSAAILSDAAESGGACGCGHLRRLQPQTVLQTGR